MTSQQLELTEETDLVPYRRGVSVREIAKGALARFLPGSLITIGGLATFFGVSIADDVLLAVGGFLGLAGALTVGFGLGLLGLGRWLYPDARVDGHRSFIAGLMSPLALFIAATTGRGWTITQLPVLLVFVGVIMALGMFFAWLTPTPENMRGEGFEPESLDQLPELQGRSS